MQSENVQIKKIFLIDDDPDDYSLFEEALQGADVTMELLWASSCQDVYERIQKFCPDLIFLDVNIPLENGFECLKRLQDHLVYCKIPIVMYSVSGNDRDINVAYGLGATLYFKKPMRLLALVSSLKSILLLPWDDPGEITGRHFISGKYMAYTGLT